VLTFNRVDDLAILRVDGLRGQPLRMVGRPEAGSTAVVLGYPLDGPFTVTPARMGRTLVALTNDAYGTGPFRREITILRGRVRPGNSGGPVLNSSGLVVGTVFGRTTSGGPDGGFSIPPERVQRELQRATSGQRDPTGPCGR
ncbi:MAG: trypsin-like peptidase domain-containing protein, partial [Solirubrobacterales bacterium]|nr:trypsin-like peptidase domain-containing protein [Solirubrobacterales bacterium]